MESFGGILLVVRQRGKVVCVEENRHLTCLVNKYHVYKLDFEQKEWVEVETLVIECSFWEETSLYHSQLMIFHDARRIYLYFIDEYWEQVIKPPSRGATLARSSWMMEALKRFIRVICSGFCQRPIGLFLIFVKE